ncbi:MAG: threonine aldolase [Elusimicrobia bacterium]|nr:MAG: threonine aldolase [Elusimicrobiota bacterium]
MTPLDFRSDTVTVPTDAMRRAAAESPVGDDVCGEDPTVNELEKETASLLGKEAALLVPSGTFANQCALLTHTTSGDEVLLAERCHIVQHEAGAAALISRAQLRTVSPDSPHLLAKDLEGRLREDVDIHFPRTALICVEQATSDGTVVDLDSLAGVHSRAKSAGVPVHMDGARLFNAAAALAVEPAVVATHADSVAICLSKGLCAPVGSLLAGSTEFIERARYNRKRMGGGMRQAGIIAGPGLVALREERPRLGEDHARAARLAAALNGIEGITLLREPEISMVFVRIPAWTRSSSELVAAMLEKGFKIYPDENGVWRFVVHRWIDDGAVESFTAALASVLA